MAIPPAPEQPTLFGSGPRVYFHWAARYHPTRFWSCVIGGAVPLVLLAIPIREALGYEKDPRIPTTYPIPNRKRVNLDGSPYDDPQ